MSRTNPFKKKRRSAHRTLLVFGEGLCEEVFLKHLRKLYSYNSNVTIKVLRGKGGTPADVVIDSYKIPGDYETRVVVVDNDKSQQEMELARKEAKRRKITLIENTPCIEALLLSILNGSKDFSNKTSDWCKKEFESKYIEKKKRSEPEPYEKLFTKSLLDSSRSKLNVLDTMINLMEGKF
jgi:Cft2 family RNA processing exonuclease